MDQANRHPNTLQKTGGRGDADAGQLCPERLPGGDDCGYHQRRPDNNPALRLYSDLGFSHSVYELDTYTFANSAAESTH